jgi:hypothetical protein
MIHKSVYFITTKKHEIGLCRTGLILIFRHGGCVEESVKGYNVV